MRALVLLVAVTGCDKLLGLHHLPDAAPDPTHDASRFMDAPPPGVVCAGTLNHVCEHEVDLAPRTIDTDLVVDTDAPACQYTTMDSPPVVVCVIATSQLTISATIRAHGSRPLVLFSSGALQLGQTAVIDVSSTGSLGAAANDVGCVPNYMLGGSNQTVMVNSAGGGAGGSFNGKGGNGGAGDNGGGASAVAGLMNLTSIRGGCRGGDGGFDLNLQHAGAGGSSGGAVYIMAAGAIDVAGTVLANGAGGLGATAGSPSDFAGGGGGGTGGAIVIDGKQLDILPSAIVLAAGGGGGAGEDGTKGGGDGKAATTTAAGAGGTVPGGSNAGTGGVGGFHTRDGSAGGKFVSQGGSGGGGGSDGFIRLFPSTTLQGIVVPAPS